MMSLVESEHAGAVQSAAVSALGRLGDPAVGGKHRRGGLGVLRSGEHLESPWRAG